MGGLSLWIRTQPGMAIRQRSAKWTRWVTPAGFKDDLWLDSDGNPLTSAAKMTEKIRRPNYGTLEVEITIDDPKAYTAPWTVKITQPLVLDSELLDYYCLENEKDYAHMMGKPTTEPK
jgi:hypothetical protein